MFREAQTARQTIYVREGLAPKRKSKLLTSISISEGGAAIQYLEKGTSTKLAHDCAIMIETQVRKVTMLGDFIVH